MTNPIYFEFVHQYEGVNFECVAEVFVELPVPNGDSDWDEMGVKEVESFECTSHPSVSGQDINLDDKDILRYFDLHVEMMVNESF
ncbi:MAG: hypothetical protein GY861_13130 [bacterium]|nr:hypothetical protein [bacterium]